MNSRISISLALACVLVLTSACGTKAINEPGVDIQAPIVHFLSPVSGDTVGLAEVEVLLQATDNDAVVRVELYLNNSLTPLRVLTEAPWSTTISPDEFPEGNHELVARAFDATGNVSTPARVMLRKGEQVIVEVPRMSLVEVITSANCAPCGLQNETYHQIDAAPSYNSRVATIKYHVWWPRPTDKLWIQSQTWSRPRTHYLFSPLPENQYTAPRGWANGKMLSGQANDWAAAATNDLSKPAGANIELSSSRTSESIALTIRVTGIATSSFNDLRLHTVVTEDEIEYNDGNSEHIHYNVMRRMYPDAEGEIISVANGQTITLERFIAIEELWDPEKLEAVVFLQSAGSKELLQAAKTKL